MDAKEALTRDALGVACCITRVAGVKRNLSCLWSGGKLQLGAAS